MQHYTEALKIDAKLLSAWNNRAMCNLKLGNFAGTEVI
jgi:hypothetical protein